MFFFQIVQHFEGQVSLMILSEHEMKHLANDVHLKIAKHQLTTIATVEY